MRKGIRRALAFMLAITIFTLSFQDISHEVIAWAASEAGKVVKEECVSQESVGEKTPVVEESDEESDETDSDKAEPTLENVETDNSEGNNKEKQPEDSVNEEITEEIYIEADADSESTVEVSEDSGSDFGVESEVVTEGENEVGAEEIDEEEAGDKETEAEAAADNQVDADAEEIVVETDEIEAVTANGSATLGAGDYLYLETKFADENWQKDNAVIYFFYQSTGGSWKNEKMLCVNEELLRVKIPDDMQGEAFKFRRVDPDCTTLPDTWGNETWSQVPSGANNQSLSNAPANCNTFKITGWNAGEWAVGTWNISNYAGETLYFMNMDVENPLGETITAVFSVDGTSSQEVSMTKEDGFEYLYKVIIPDGGDYNKVEFRSGTESLDTADILDGTFSPNSSNTFYYKRTVTNEYTLSSWDEYPAGDSSVTGKTLYFNALDFPVETDKNLTIKIGAFTETIQVIEGAYSYTIPENIDATSQTVLEISDGNAVYRVLWNDLSKDTVIITPEGIAAIAEEHDSTSDTRTIYFDATLSKLSYVGDWGDKGIPLAGKTDIYYYAWNANNPSENTGEAKKTLTKVADRTVNGNTWTDIYQVELDRKYTKILFYSNAIVDTSCAKTVDLTIPDDLRYPCFYADSSDNAIYLNTVNRDGYWDEVYTVRNAGVAKNSTVVDVSTGNFSRDSDILYLNTTLYDYYTDYELNGNNRDSYIGPETYVNKVHWQYQTFRHFNQALSEYYRENIAGSPIYWGNFQNPCYGENASPFTHIADTLNLYGYENNTSSELFKKFFYENNSMFGRDGEKLAVGTNATIGLAANELTNGNLMLKTESGVVEAPFFDESFLTRNNSKNTVLGNVYHNVMFPFVKKELASKSDTTADGIVDYWYFNSADQNVANKNLKLQYDSDGGYYLASQSSAVYGQTAELKITDVSNYFPLNSVAESVDATKLNYGFGQKLEFTFRLTKDGTVLTDKEEKVPIEFNFSGDDDVWVYIDDQLVLDVGGGHGMVEGRINFADKKSWVSSIKNTDSGGTTASYETSFPSNLNENQDFYSEEHTLTMFYMERGIWESNLVISFNFPDENKLSVEKTVDYADVNGIFEGVFDVTQLFDFNIKNQATHYAAKEDDLIDETGFVIKQYDIPDYGSATTGKLENAVNASYTMSNSQKQVTYGEVDENGYFSLGNGEKITFSNQFRRGSYIYLKEKVNEELFDTMWEIYEDGEKVSSSVVAVSNTVMGGTSTLGGSGTVISDLRQEKYQSGYDTENALINNEGYRETGKAKIGDGAAETSDTIVFRSYIQPDNITTGLNLEVKETNKVKVGAIVVEKQQAEGSKELNETYQVKVVFSNIAGLNLENETENSGRTYETVLTLRADETQIIKGIPVGTQYVITEITPMDGSYLETVSQKKDDNNVVIGNDNVEINGKTVTGVVNADDTSTDNVDTFIFTNKLVPTFSLNLEKKWKNSKDEDITEDLPDFIWVQIQRKIQNAQDASYESVKVDGCNDSNCIKIQGTDDWKLTIDNLQKYKEDVESEENLYTYRVVEMKEESGTFKSVEEGSTIVLNGITYYAEYQEENITPSEADENGTVYDYVITNIKDETFTFEFTKVKSTSNGGLSKLTGAEFTLYGYKGENSAGPGDYETLLNQISGVTASTDTWEVVKLTGSDGDAVYTTPKINYTYTWYMVETKVPSGMQKPEGCWKITYVPETETDDTNGIHDHVKIEAIGEISSMAAFGYLESAQGDVPAGWFIQNMEQWTVPNSGGAGSSYIYLSGVILMLAASLWWGLLYYRKETMQT